MYLYTDCSSDESDGDADGEPQSELMHLLSDQQRESMLVVYTCTCTCMQGKTLVLYYTICLPTLELEQRRAKLVETAHSSNPPPHKVFDHCTFIYIVQIVQFLDSRSLIVAGVSERTTCR